MNKEVADAIEKLTKEIKWLGNGDAGGPNPMGAIEGHAVLTKEAGALIESGLSDVAQAIREHADAIREVTFVFEKKFGVQPEELE